MLLAHVTGLARRGELENWLGSLVSVMECYTITAMGASGWQNPVTTKKITVHKRSKSTVETLIKEIKYAHE